jgi:uncharacterized RDD family membrane protein YckC
MLAIMDINPSNLMEQGSDAEVPSFRPPSPVSAFSNEKQSIDGSFVPVPSAPIQTHYGGFWIRVAASMIDGAAFVLLALLASVILSIPSLTILRVTARFYILLPVFALFYLMLSIFLIRKYRTTPGKMVAGLEILPDTGVEMTVGRILLRELIGKIVSGMFFCVGYLMAAFTNQKKAAHDMIASTTVIYQNEGRKTVSAILGALSLMAILGIYFGLIAGSLFSGLNELQKNGPATIKSTVPVQLNIKEDESVILRNDNVLQPLSDEKIDMYKDQEEVYPGSAGIEKNKKEDKDIYDYISESIVLIKQHKEQSGSYKGLKDRLINHSGIVTGCGFKRYNNRTTLDISPDGKKFVIHQKLCVDPNKSYCFDEKSSEISTVDTALVEKNYNCE